MISSASTSPCSAAALYPSSAALYHLAARFSSFGNTKATLIISVTNLDLRSGIA